MRKLSPIFQALIPRKHHVFALAVVAIALLLCELLLHVLSSVSPRVAQVLSPGPVLPAIEDAALGWRPNPEVPDHDRWGFRNASVPEHAFLVALGDSQTYGTGVTREQAWPAQLAQLASLSVYNMAFGGWGPTHSLLLLDEALKLRPKVVVQAFYRGNDLFDSYNHVYRLGGLPTLRTTDGAALDAIFEREDSAPLFPARYTTLFAKRGSWLATHSRMYGLLRGFKHLVEPTGPPQPRAQDDDDDDEVAFAHGGLKTIFTPKYRRSALNQGDPRIIEGRRLALEAIRLMRDRLQEQGIAFVVLLLPTKELTFKHLVERHTSPPFEYWALVDTEEKFSRESQRFLRRMGVDFIDPVPELRAHLERGEPLYPESDDGHPTPRGHRIIAEIVLSHLKKRVLQQPSVPTISQPSPAADPPASPR
jgi:hypothetical protein